MISVKKAFTLPISDLSHKFRVENNNLDIADLLDNCGFTAKTPMARSKSPTCGHPKFPQARRRDYGGFRGDGVGAGAEPNVVRFPLGYRSSRVIHRACLWTRRRALDWHMRRLVHRCEAPGG